MSLPADQPGPAHARQSAFRESNATNEKGQALGLPLLGELGVAYRCQGVGLTRISGPPRATAFFTFVSARYERGSIILTSNKGFGEWGELLGDTVIASAILDRLLDHSHVLNIRGESYRLKDKRQAGLFPFQQHLPSRQETAPAVPTTDRIAEQ